MILASDPNGIIRSYAVTVHDKLYVIQNIIFYKENKTILQTNAGWLEGETETGTYDIDPIEIPAKEIKLKRKPDTYDGTTYIVATGKDWSGHLRADLYIPAADLGIHRTAYEIRANGRRVYSIWKGTRGIHLEALIKNLDDHLHLLYSRYEETHKEVDSSDLSILREDLFMENLDKLRTLAEEYYTERKRLANLTVEDLDLPAIEQEKS